jgi:serine/threonine protein kinase
MDLILGSPIYMAPEIIKGDEYGEKVDVWSVGVVCFILLTGTPPFYAKTKKEVFSLIKKTEPKFNDEIWKEISQEAKDFV